MDIPVLIAVTIYFAIGWVLSGWLNVEDKDEVAVFIFVFWPLVILFLAVILVLAIAALVSVLISKLVYGFHAGVEESDEGDGSHGAV